jgi:hypothetical protein
MLMRPVAPDIVASLFAMTHSNICTARLILIKAICALPIDTSAHRYWERSER